MSATLIQPTQMVLDTDGTLAANSDTKVGSQKAFKTYIDSLAALTNYVQGFEMASVGDYIATLTVGPPVGSFTGICKDSTNVKLLTLGARSTITINTNAAINGNDSFTGAGTATSNTGSTSVSGSGTSFLTVFGTRAATGTSSTSSTTATGTSTKYLSEFKPGDLFGNATKGYSQVSSVESDTSLTLTAAIPGGSIAGGSTVNVIENPTISVGTKKFVQVSTITDNTTLAVTTTEAVTQTAQAFRVGGVPTGGMTKPHASVIFFHVWLGNGSSGTGVYVSTQRTTPFGITNYNSYVRRLGAIAVYPVTPVVVPFVSASIVSNIRELHYETEIGGNFPARLLSAGSVTSAWTRIQGAQAIAPTAYCGIVNFTVFHATQTVYAHLRGSNIGASAQTRNAATFCATNGYGSRPYDLFLDDGQAMDYINSTASTSSYIDTIGFKEKI